ncbi:hypothetical protein [Desulfosporosinus sp. FKA]|uniref:hypothetical protein n=1 Tax=Desulfosporosinus sp. FKA TaxID=1969834 RepID=UPI000B499B8C|nr:hypothetical protein [Desulfosporosinus sp. FKA]
MNRKLSIIKTAIFLLFVAWTISFIWIKDIADHWKSEFVFGYLILLVLLSVYLLWRIISNIRKLKREQIKKKITKFFGLFVSFWILNIILNYLFKSRIDVFSKIVIPLGMALGITFIPEDDE